MFQQEKRPLTTKTPMIKIIKNRKMLNAESTVKQLSDQIKTGKKTKRNIKTVPMTIVACPHLRKHG